MSLRNVLAASAMTRRGGGGYDDDSYSDSPAGQNEPDVATQGATAAADAMAAALAATLGAVPNLEETDDDDLLFDIMEDDDLGLSFAFRGPEGIDNDSDDDKVKTQKKKVLDEEPVKETKKKSKKDKKNKSQTPEEKVLSQNAQPRDSAADAMQDVLATALAKVKALKEAKHSDQDDNDYPTRDNPYPALTSKKKTEPETKEEKAAAGATAAADAMAAALAATLNAVPDVAGDDLSLPSRLSSVDEDERKSKSKSKKIKDNAQYDKSKPPKKPLPSKKKQKQQPSKKRKSKQKSKSTKDNLSASSSDNSSSSSSTSSSNSSSSSSSGSTSSSGSSSRLDSSKSPSHLKKEKEMPSTAEIRTEIDADEKTDESNVNLMTVGTLLGGRRSEHSKGSLNLEEAIGLGAGVKEEVDGRQLSIYFQDDDNDESFNKLKSDTALHEEIEALKAVSTEENGGGEPKTLDKEDMQQRQSEEKITEDPQQNSPKKKRLQPVEQVQRRHTLNQGTSNTLQPAERIHQRRYTINQAELKKKEIELQRNRALQIEAEKKEARKQRRKSRKRVSKKGIHESGLGGGKQRQSMMEHQDQNRELYPVVHEESGQQQSRNFSNEMGVGEKNDPQLLEYLSRIMVLEKENQKLMGEMGSFLDECRKESQVQQLEEELRQLREKHNAPMANSIPRESFQRRGSSEPEGHLDREAYKDEEFEFVDEPPGMDDKRRERGLQEDDICCYCLCKWIPDPLVMFVCSDVLKMDD